MSASEPSQRQLRVGEAVRHALATVLHRGDLRDPSLTGVSITVSEVRVTPDLRQATCYVTPLGATSGQGPDETRVVEALTRASAFLRGQLAREVRLKYMPALQFRADRSFDEAQRIDEVLKRPEVARDLAAGNAAEDPEAPDAPDPDDADAPDGPDASDLLDEPNPDDADAPDDARIRSGTAPGDGSSTG